MIIGAHALIYSRDAEADRAFLRETLKLPHVDVGGGWLIFALPPSEIAVHPARRNAGHEVYLMCDDVQRFTAAMARRGIRCGAVQDRGWGLLTEVVLPGGGKLGVYEPRHRRPRAPRRQVKRRRATAGRASSRRTSPKSR